MTVEKKSTSKRPAPIGERFHRQIVLSEAPRTESCPRTRRLMVRCDCGTVHTAPMKAIIYGKAKSCGCLQKEWLLQRFTTHGANSHPLFNTWRAMIARCENPSNIGFARYGGRGIKVCDEWKADPHAFFTAVGPKPFPGASLDRIDNDSGYHPGNVRWATRKEQGRNRSVNVWIDTPDGKMILREAADHFGFNRWTLTTRHATGWPLDNILLPVGSKNPRRSPQ